MWRWKFKQAKHRENRETYRNALSTCLLIIMLRSLSAIQYVSCYNRYQSQPKYPSTSQPVTTQYLVTIVINHNPSIPVHHNQSQCRIQLQSLSVTIHVSSYNLYQQTHVIQGYNYKSQRRIQLQSWSVKYHVSVKIYPEAGSRLSFVITIYNVHSITTQ
jgi:hypothetical protein